MKKVVFWVSIAIFIAILIIGLRVMSSEKEKVKEQLVKNSNSNQTILMVSDNSKFKRKLREKLINDYKDKYSIEIKNLKFLKTLDPKKYVKVIVIDSVWMWEGMNKEVVKFAKKHENEKNILLLMSAGDPKYKFSNAKVDSYTMATEKVSLDKMYQDIVNKIGLTVSKKVTKSESKVDVDSETKASKDYKKEGEK